MRIQGVSLRRQKPHASQVVVLIASTPPTLGKPDPVSL